MLDEVLYSVSDVLNLLPEQRNEERSICDAVEELATKFDSRFDYMMSSSTNVELSYHYIQTAIRHRYQCNLNKLGIKNYQIQASQTWEQFRQFNADLLNYAPDYRLDEDTYDDLFLAFDK